MLRAYPGRQKSLVARLTSRMSGYACAPAGCRASVYSPHIRRRRTAPVFVCNEQLVNSKASLGQMVMGIDIRKAAPFDAASACSLLRRSIEQGCEADYRGRPGILDAWLGNKTIANVAAWFASPTNFAIVAERDGQLLGLALLTQAGKLALCYVQPEAVRGGVGSAMLAAVEEQARAWDIRKLHLQSPASAAPFFERHGYSNAGLEKACFGLECNLLWKALDSTPGDAASADPARKRFCNCSQ